MCDEYENYQLVSFREIDPRVGNIGAGRQLSWQVKLDGPEISLRFGRFQLIDGWGGSPAGWPDEFVEKIAQNVAQTILGKIHT
jgi:hypothetical protein